MQLSCAQLMFCQCITCESTAPVNLKKNLKVINVSLYYKNTDIVKKCWVINNAIYHGQR